MTPPTPHTDKLFAARYRLAEGAERCGACRLASPSVGLLESPWSWCSRHGCYVANNKVCNEVEVESREEAII